MIQEERKYVFVTEWFDRTANRSRSFLLSYYPRDNSIELYDLNLKRIFLRRIIYDGISEKDLYLYNVINILSREMRLVRYADSFTKELFDAQSERTIVLVKCFAVATLGRLLDAANESHVSLMTLKTILLTNGHRDELGRFTQIENASLPDYFNENVILVELIGENAVEKVRRIIDSFLKVCKGRQRNNDDILYQSTAISYIEKLTVLMSSRQWPSIVPKNCVCCVIKPHAVKEGFVGKILMEIDTSKYCVKAINMLRLDYEGAKTFHAVYDTVVPEYPGMVAQLSDGTLMAMCITSTNDCISADFHESFREFVGPHDPEIARLIRPATLRAKYGKDKIHNAVHCNDLPEDGATEVEFFMKS